MNPAQQVVDFFVQIEKKWLEKWYKEGVVKKYLHKNDTSEKTYSFMDGPITANNPMGVHHAWGRTYKDLWQKYHNLKGHAQRFQNGFDCQGLWVEVEVEKELGLRSKRDIENLVPGDKDASIAKFVQLCKDRVKKYSTIQTDQSKRLGYFMDWENSYFTMSPENNYMIWHFLKTCFENGWIYKGHESVPWCPRCETAISQHEMLTEDYKEVVHESIYLALPIVGREKEYLLVWTTTPWTLPANIAVAVDRKIEYSLVSCETGTYWVAKDLVVSLFPTGKVLKTMVGEELVGTAYRGPFDTLEAVAKVASENQDTFHKVIATDDQIMPISTTEGTGLVHTAVSAGTEDFRLGKKHGLPMIPIIADNADYFPKLGFLSGKNAKKNPRIILDYLVEESKGDIPWVYKIAKYKHRYPGCWRCKAELVWKVADEWYIAMDKASKSDKRTLRERMMTVAQKITWMPEFGLDRELDWLKNMHDWLISKKNRYWGLALPIYECKKCGTFEVIGSRDELKERASAGWEQFEGKTPHKPFIDGVTITCASCKGEVHRIEDVGNPWLDAGIVSFSTISKGNSGSPLYLTDRNEWKRWFPMDFITESFPGQFKNWFYALIAMSTVLEDTNPFKRVLGFGTLLGEDGRPMHKSWGNSIAFHEGADEIGVDVMRWMYARHNPAENLLFGPKRASDVRRQFFLLLWNIFKFYRDYASQDGFDPKAERVETTHVLDLWILSRFSQLVKTIDASLSAFDAKTAALESEAFISDFSTWYIRRSRDRVGSSAQDVSDRTAFYQTTHEILVNLMIVLSPFLPFITEEIYTTLTGRESVHLASWPPIEDRYNENLQSDIQIVRQIAETGNRIRKEVKIKVRQPLAQVQIRLPKKDGYILQDMITQYDRLIKDELNVKNIAYQIGDDLQEVQVAYDTDITPALKLEGDVRDLIREIQIKRKELGVALADRVDIAIDPKFTSYTDAIKIAVNAHTVSYEETLTVQKTP